MKANSFLKRCGPFKVDSISQDGHGVRMIVYPAFPRYGDDWVITRSKGEGGGPGIFTAIALAKELEGFLNQPYDEGTVTAWHQTLAEMKRIRELAAR